MARKRKILDLYVIEYSRKNAVRDYDEDLYIDCEDEGNDNERKGVEAVVDGMASEQDISGVYKDDGGRVVIFSSLDDANERAEDLMEQLKEEDIDGWDLDVEEEPEVEEEEEEGRACYTVVKKYFVDPVPPYEDARNSVISTITVNVVAAAMEE